MKKLEKPYLNTVDLTPEEIQEFQAITLRKFNRKLTSEEAREQLARMVLAYELIINDIEEPIDSAQLEADNEQ